MNRHRAERILDRIQAVNGVDGYTPSETLGVGGSAAVFKAHAMDGSLCALKIYDSEFTDQVERLDRELSLKGHDCPHLVRIYGGGSVVLDGETFTYLAMEYVDGVDLSERISSAHRFDDPAIRRILGQLHAAADYLLKRGLCHRDIKPANIRLRPDGAAVLLDLGVIRPVSGSDVTDDERGRRFIATRRYTPPELQHRTHKENAEAWEAITVYQIGAVLYELIHGVRLFAHVADHPPADLVVAVDSFVPPVMRSDVGDDLTSLTRRCLVKDARARVQHSSMSKIAECASSLPPAPAPAPVRAAVEQHLRQAADRVRSEIGVLQVRAAEQNQLRRTNFNGAVQIAVAALAALAEEPYKLTSFPIHQGPGDGGGIGCAIVCGESLEKRIVGTLRLVLLVNPGTTAEFVLIRGIGLRATMFEGRAETTMKVIKGNQLLPHLEQVWHDVYDEQDVRRAVTGWIDGILDAYFTATASIWEKRLDAERRELELHLQGRGSVFREVERVPSVAFTRTTENHIRSMFLK
ncbi:MAG: serine/threonine protein kinase [Labilithrix sp.]|nr:serine/threonine protein kinase [Labilithrix sp.]